METDRIPDALWLRLSEFIAGHTGLHFPPERHADLRRGIEAAAAEFGFQDSAKCADWLLSTPLTRPQLHALASHLTIGETYFFRERRTFDALANNILPELIRRRRGHEQRLRLWSAACSTGEEPYSLAILIRQLLPDWRDWQVTILATDINERFLSKAVEGIYGEWSFRDLPPAFKQQHFTPTPDGCFAIAPEIRTCVRFMRMNLARDFFPSVTSDMHTMDVILCRNVLIYFAPSQAHKLVENLRDALTDEGWLAVSPSECSQALFARFATVNFPDSILYRKCRARPTPMVAEASIEVSLPEAPAEMPHETPDSPVVTSPGLRPFSLLARELANQGRLADALSTCEQWIGSDKIDPAAHYLHAVILQEMGEHEAARRSLQRAVYLQPDFALGHFALGNLARADNRGEQAARHFTNSLRLLRLYPPEEVLADSDGITAGRLVEMINTALARSLRPLPSSGDLLE